MSVKIQLRRGSESGLPSLAEGEAGFTTDSNKLFIGTQSSGNIEIGISNILTDEIYQASHGFDDDFIYHNGTSWVKAIADSDEHTATHFSIAIDVDNFQLITMGEIDCTGMTDAESNSLNTGQYYFLSQTVSGKVTSTKASSGIVQSVLKTNGANDASILISEPATLTGSIDGGDF